MQDEEGNVAVQEYLGLDGSQLADPVDLFEQGAAALLGMFGGVGGFGAVDSPPDPVAGEGPVASKPPAVGARNEADGEPGEAQENAQTVDTGEGGQTSSDGSGDAGPPADSPAGSGGSPSGSPKPSGSSGRRGGKRRPKPKPVAPPTPTGGQEVMNDPVAQIAAAAMGDRTEARADALMAGMGGVLGRASAAVDGLACAEPELAPLDPAELAGIAKDAVMRVTGAMEADVTAATEALTWVGDRAHAQLTVVEQHAAAAAQMGEQLLTDARTGATTLRSELETGLASLGTAMNAARGSALAKAKVIAKNLDKKAASKAKKEGEEEPEKVDHWAKHGGAVTMAIAAANNRLSVQYGDIKRASQARFEETVVEGDLIRGFAWVPATVLQLQVLQIEVAAEHATVDQKVADRKQVVEDSHSATTTAIDGLVTDVTAPVDAESAADEAEQLRDRIAESAAAQMEGLRAAGEALGTNLGAVPAADLDAAMAAAEGEICAWEAGLQAGMAVQAPQVDAGDLLNQQIEKLHTTFADSLVDLPSQLETELTTKITGMSVGIDAMVGQMEGAAAGVAQTVVSARAQIASTVVSLASQVNRSETILTDIAREVLTGGSPRQASFEAAEARFRVVEHAGRADYADLKQRASTIRESTEIEGTKEIPLVEALRGRSVEEIGVIKDIYENTGSDLEATIIDELENSKELLEAMAHLTGDRVLGALFALHNAEGDDDEERIEKILRGLSPEEAAALRAGETLDGGSLNDAAMKLMEEVNAKDPRSGIRSLMEEAKEKDLTKYILEEARDEMDGDLEKQVFDALLNDEDGSGKAMATALRIKEDPDFDTTKKYLNLAHTQGGDKAKGKDDNGQVDDYGDIDTVRRMLKTLKDEDGKSVADTAIEDASDEERDWIDAAVNKGVDSDEALAAQMMLGNTGDAMIDTIRDEEDYNVSEYTRVYMDLAKRTAEHNKNLKPGQKKRVLKDEFKKFEGVFANKYGAQYADDGEGVDGLFVDELGRSDRRYAWMTELRKGDGFDENGSLNMEMRGRAMHVATHGTGTNEELVDQVMPKDTTKEQAGQMAAGFEGEALAADDADNVDIHEALPDDYAGAKELDHRLALLGTPETAKDYRRRAEITREHALEGQFNEEMSRKERPEIWKGIDNMESYVAGEGADTRFIDQEQGTSDNSALEVPARASSEAMDLHNATQRAITDDEANTAAMVVGMTLGVAFGPLLTVAGPLASLVGGAVIGGIAELTKGLVAQGTGTASAPGDVGASIAVSTLVEAGGIISGGTLNQIAKLKMLSKIAQNATMAKRLSTVMKSMDTPIGALSKTKGLLGDGAGAVQDEVLTAVLEGREISGEAMAQGMATKTGQRKLTAPVTKALERRKAARDRSTELDTTDSMSLAPDAARGSDAALAPEHQPSGLSGGLANETQATLGAAADAISAAHDPRGAFVAEIRDVGAELEFRKANGLPIDDELTSRVKAVYAQVLELQVSRNPILKEVWDRAADRTGSPALAEYYEVAGQFETATKLRELADSVSPDDMGALTELLTDFDANDPTRLLVEDGFEPRTAEIWAQMARIQQGGGSIEHLQHLVEDLRLDVTADFEAIAPKAYEAISSKVTEQLGAISAEINERFPGMMSHGRDGLDLHHAVLKTTHPDWALKGENLLLVSKRVHRALHALTAASSNVRFDRIDPTVAEMIHSVLGLDPSQVGPDRP